MINKNFKDTLACSRHSSNIYWQNVECKKEGRRRCVKIFYFWFWFLFPPQKVNWSQRSLIALKLLEFGNLQLLVRFRPFIPDFAFVLRQESITSESSLPDCYFTVFLCCCSRTFFQVALVIQCSILGKASSLALDLLEIFSPLFIVSYVC